MVRPDSPDAQVARVLSHPLRPQILQILTQRGEASPNEIAAELDVPLGTLSYHTRLLRDAGWIELVREVPRRGAVEHFYRAVAHPWIEDAQWERLPLGVRRRLATMMPARTGSFTWWRMSASAERSPQSATVGARKGRVSVSRRPLYLSASAAGSPR